jgi:6-phospho-beta-glucosidase
LHRAYCNKEGPLVDRVTSLLAQRNIDWYQEGVIPALTAFSNVAPTVLPLNTQNTAAIPGIPNNAIVETWCLVSDGKAAPLKAPPLPPGPARMTAQLVAYETAVLALPKHPSPGAVCAVLTQHPLSRSGRLSDLGAAISAMAANS